MHELDATTFRESDIGPGQAEAPARTRRLLCLTYYFPPIGGAGTQRSLSFARHLPRHGWAPLVVTGPRNTEDRWAPVDEGLADGLPSSVDIARIAGEPPDPVGGFESRLRRWMRMRSAFARWWSEGAVEVGRAQSGIDLVYASMSPYESGMAAAKLAGELGTPWVADLRDPWALDEVLVFPTRVHRWRERQLMRRVLATASRIVMNTPEAAHALHAAFPEIPAHRVAVVPNGYEPEDFAGPPPARSDDAFRIVHTGYLHTELGHRHRRGSALRRLMGGGVAPVDFLTRSHVYLLEAIRRVHREHPELVGRIELHLAGVTSEADRRLASDPWVRLHGFLSHEHSVELVRSADLLFLPMHDLPRGTRSRIVPGKTYEYLASGRPVLAALPDGDARDLVGGIERNHVCRPSDERAMADAIAREVHLSRNREHEPADERVLSFERPRLAARLAGVLDAALLERSGR